MIQWIKNSMGYVIDNEHMIRPAFTVQTMFDLAPEWWMDNFLRGTTYDG